MNTTLNTLNKQGDYDVQDFIIGLKSCIAKLESSTKGSGRVSDQHHILTGNTGDSKSNTKAVSDGCSSASGGGSTGGGNNSAVSGGHDDNSGSYNPAEFSKTQHIKLMLNLKPKARPKEMLAALEDIGYKTNLQYISNVKCRYLRRLKEGGEKIAAPAGYVPLL